MLSTNIQGIGGETLIAVDFNWQAELFLDAFINTFQVFITYVAYGLGMSVLLIAITLALAFAKQGLVRRLRSVLHHVQRVSAGFLVVAGLYIVWFWADDLSSDAGEQGAAAGVVERWSASLTNWIGARSGSIGLFLGGLVLIALVSTLMKRLEPSEATGSSAAADDRTPSPV